MRDFFRRLKRYVQGTILLTLIALFWPQGADFNEMARERHDEDNTLQPNAPLRIGVSWPIAQRGDELINGMRLAINHSLEDQLLDGHAVELIIHDDEGTVQNAQKIATSFADDEEIDLVIGYANDNQAIAAGVIYQSARVLQMVVGAPTTQLATYNHPYLVRTLPTAKDFALKLSNSFDKPIKTFAVVLEKNGYWEEMASQFTIDQIKKGAKRAYFRTFPAELPPDYVRETLEIRNQNVDAILFAGNAVQAARFINKARAMGLTTPILCTTVDLETIEQTVRADTQNVILPGFYDPDAKTPANKRFLSDYLKTYETLPNGWAAQGYDALRLALTAIHESQSQKAADIAWTIRYMPDYKGATGLYRFTKQGDVEDKDVFLRTP
ncbi:ABC transporter substrate-binding protein [Terasakiella pusilla]